ncbi:MAG: hypothetical protein B7O98_02355 [Zestosphaera tikiterensis]|uniref:DUF447 domain-containing protein n=1 Tax=Zestosphaera tikiterensis TaxID=1973259 RepID=A0A2R7Y6Y6_9CREN|nr:MAG: hypothetical protein B7O98_02355 [Zestosphaera tikiterensis]
MIEQLLSKYLRLRLHEALIVTIGENGFNVAPMGVEFLEGMLFIKPYKHTKTFLNISFNPEVTLNLTQESKYFFKSIFKPWELLLKPAKKVKAPIVDGDFDLYIEGILTLYKEDPLRPTFKLEVLNAYEGCGSKLALSRANNALLEALVYYTKVKDPKFRENTQEYLESLKLLKLNLSLVKKLGDEELKGMAIYIEDKLRELSLHE